ncbi:Dbl homology domain-containing protein, partial [Basidiobolus meristosporus CBS 931.73]
MAKTSDPIVRPHDTKIIFQGIEPLYKLSQQLCFELKHEIENWNPSSRIGRLFLKRQRSWDIYPRFVDNYSFAREAIQRAEGTTSFNEFIKSVAKNDTKRQTLKEFLIIPIQRVTRYTLLLKDLLKQTREDHPDYADVSQALKFMKNLAFKVNEVKQREEERTRLFTIFNSIENCPPTMINSKRRFMLETDVLETRSNRRLHVVLYSDYLMLATSGKYRPSRAGEKWVFWRLIDLRHIILFNVPDTKDATDLTVIFVSNPFPTTGTDSIEPLVRSPTSATDSSSSSPPSSPRGTPRTSFVESKKRPTSKKQLPTNQYNFQHADQKSKVEFLIALESELSKINKRLGGQPRNFIQTLGQPHADLFP